MDRGSAEAQSRPAATLIDAGAVVGWKSRHCDKSAKLSALFVKPDVDKRTMGGRHQWRSVLLLSHEPNQSFVLYRLSRSQ